MQESAIFKGLNSNQIQAVKATEGKVRVIAGAGSGKTRVLANRFAYLVNEIGIDPAHILCMTFTNKAAGEMKKRIHKLVSMGAVNDYICTIHGLCVKILRKEIHRLGYPQKFLILDDEDSKSLMSQVMEEQQITKQLITVNQLLSNVHMNKATSNYIPYLLPNAQWPEETNTSTYLRYLQLQRKNYALDFNDIIYFTLYIFDTYPDALNYWQQQFDYIQVDEVQDCSNNDWQIINALSAYSGNLFVVGDPDQAIYEWRGAKPDTLVQFQADTDIILDQNYRSTPNILSVANSIISNNLNRVQKNLQTSLPPSTLVLHKHAKNEEEEAQWIATQIREMLKQQSTYSDFAILYRASHQSRYIEQALIQAGLPYTIWGGIRFFERQEIKDCLAYLRLIQQDDDLAFQRIANTPSRKFGKQKAQLLKELAEKEGLTLYETLKAHLHEAPFNKTDLKPFVQMIETYRQQKDTLTISDLMDKVLTQSGLEVYYRNDVDQDRIENLNELMHSIQYYEESHADEEITLETYLQDIALLTNLDYKKDTSTIKLMTIHQSKGLEFPYVFIVGLTEGIFPSHRSIRDRKRNGLEEERRLMYVAITRAEKALFLTESEGYNHTTKSEKYPSRFISEISKDLIQVEGDIDPSLLVRRDSLVKLVESDFNEDREEFQVGDTVTHHVFGEGTVTQVRTSNQSCEVQFGNKTRNITWNHLEKA